MPYTLGNSGILVKEKKYDEIAELIHLINEDNNFKKKIIERQKERLKTFEFDKITSTLKIILNEVR